MNKCHVINELLKIILKGGNTSTSSLAEQLSLNKRTLQNHLKRLSLSACINVWDDTNYSKKKLDVCSIQGKTVNYKLNTIFKTTLNKLTAKEKNNILYIVASIHFCEDLHYYSHESKINFLFSLVNYSIKELQDNSYTSSNKNEVENILLKKYNLYTLILNNTIGIENEPLMLYYHSAYSRNNTVYFLFYDQGIHFKFVRKKDIHMIIGVTSQNLKRNIENITKTYMEINNVNAKYFLHKENSSFDIKQSISMEIDNSLLALLNKDFFEITINSYNKSTSTVTIKESYNFLFPFLKMHIDKIKIIKGETILIEDLKEYFNSVIYSNLSNIPT